jgi:hypothetical protein
MGETDKKGGSIVKPKPPSDHLGPNIIYKHPYIHAHIIVSVCLSVCVCVRVCACV